MFFFFLLFRHAFSEVPRPIALKLSHMVVNCLNFIIQVQKCGGAYPQKNLGTKKHAKFRSILYNLQLWSRISPERLRISKIGKLIFPDRFLLRSTKKIWWTLVHWLLRISCEKWTTKMHFYGQLPKSTTLVDPEMTLDGDCALSCTTHMCFGANH